MRNADYHPMTTKNSTKATLQRLRVPLGFLTAILFLVFSQPSWQTIALGAPIAFIGVAIRAWAAGHLRKNAELAVSGPYSYTRNPLYFGSFVLALGIVICGGSWWLAGLLLGCFLAVYVPVMQAEAAHMHELFPRDFAAYKQNVPLFLPRLTAWRKDEAARFDQRLYLKYREYRALMGVVLVLGILALKIVLR
jgi:protein-S-isoprenylcysteine O-methyltransferase Ste14